MFKLDQAIAEWRKEMLAAGITRPEILDELENHLREDLQRLMNSGHAEAEAFQEAAHQFGGGKQLKQEFIKIHRRRFALAPLNVQEKKYLYRGLAFVVPAYICGLLFCHFGLIPVAVAASRVDANWIGLPSITWDADIYIHFVNKLMVGVGLAFEIPVVILVAVKIGWLDYSTLSKARRCMIIINLVLGALLTTPEAMTTILMAVPLQLLYEISVWTAWDWERIDKKCQMVEAAD